MQNRLLLAADIGTKFALIVLLLLGVVFPDLPQFEGKAFGLRVVAYTVAVLVLPAAWFLGGRRWRYPVVVDLLWTVPFLIDTVGNFMDWYDDVSWWDDATHFVHGMLLTGGFAVLVRSHIDSRWVLAGLCVGFGATAAITWELLEYIAFVRNSREFGTAYQDTLGDLFMGLLGSTVAAAVAFVAMSRSSGRTQSPVSRPVA